MSYGNWDEEKSRVLHELERVVGLVNALTDRVGELKESVAVLRATNPSNSRTIPDWLIGMIGLLTVGAIGQGLLTWRDVGILKARDAYFHGETPQR